jgi:hypothetical protein
MGVLWRVFAPRPLKKARRAMHPTWIAEDAIVRAARGRRRRGTSSSGCATGCGLLLAVGAAVLAVGWPLMVFQTHAPSHYQHMQAYTPWWVIDPAGPSHYRVTSGAWGALEHRYGGPYGPEEVMDIWGPYRSKADAESQKHQLQQGSTSDWTLNSSYFSVPNPGQVTAGQARRVCVANCNPPSHPSALGWGVEAGWLALLILVITAIVRSSHNAARQAA